MLDRIINILPKNILERIKEEKESIKYDSDLVDLILDKTFKELKNNNITYEEFISINNNLANVLNTTSSDLFMRLHWLNMMGLNEFYHLKENHEEVYEIFDNFNKMLNENNIEYYYTSGILSYLNVGKELERYHHDLDVFILYEHLQKIEDVCDSYAFTFKRIYGPREDGVTTRRVFKVYYKDKVEIPITLFMYERELDGSIVQKDYYYEDGKLMVENLDNSPESAELSFDEEYKYHNDIPYKSISLEALYLCKDGARPKDIYDCKKFKSSVDQEKYKRLIKACKKNKPNTHHEVKDQTIIDYVRY